MRARSQVKRKCRIMKLTEILISKTNFVSWLWALSAPRWQDGVCDSRAVPSFMHNGHWEVKSEFSRALGISSAHSLTLFSLEHQKEKRKLGWFPVACQVEFTSALVGDSPSFSVRVMAAGGIWKPGFTQQRELRGRRVRHRRRMWIHIYLFCKALEFKFRHKAPFRI